MNGNSEMLDRRTFVKAAGVGAAASVLVSSPAGASHGSLLDTSVENPRWRVPMSFIIDDSTCLVNMGHFCMPQFATAWPERESYRKPWRNWPREIPDAFVREFGEWCAEQGVKGKYSIVPNPACVGWLDRELPGWSRRELLDSLRLVRELLVPHWDIHPEMITHTRVIDLKTGRPLPEINAGTMENSYPQEKKSVDELAEYLAYALRILRRCDLPCDGVTTPGGFGNRVKSELSLAVQQAVADVYQVEIPHYFKYVAGGDESTQPKLEHVSDGGGDQPRLTVNVPAGTGDWFGGWDGDLTPQGHRYASDDARSGRMVELIERGEPAVMLCHWPGMYCQGSKTGFQHFQKVVLALKHRFADRTLWMKVSEMARYAAARELTRRTVQRRDGQEQLVLQAPFACPNFTVRLKSVPPCQLQWIQSTGQTPLAEVRSRGALQAGRFVRDDRDVVVCVDLPRGQSSLALQLTM